jgi:hypothetical protein
MYEVPNSTTWIIWENLALILNRISSLLCIHPSPSAFFKDLVDAIGMADVTDTVAVCEDGWEFWLGVVCTSSFQTYVILQ